MPNLEINFGPFFIGIGKYIKINLKINNCICRVIFEPLKPNVI